jgi:hypothetical protein
MAPNRDPELLAAVTEAVNANPLEEDPGVAWDEWSNAASPDDEAPSEPAAPGGTEEQTAEDPVVADPPEAADAVQDEEVADEFWGVDLSDIPVEARKAILAKLEQQEGTIHKLQQRVAEVKAPVAETPDPVEAPSDEDILRGLGLDPENIYDPAQAAALLNMAKATMALEERVAEMTQADTTREVETAWNSELDQLESTYGKLPFTRIQVLQYAVEEGSPSPADAYFKLTAPVRKEVANAAAEARRATMKKEAQGGVRPTSGTGDVPSVTKGMSMRDAVAAAARAAEKETKLSWKDAVKRRLVVTQEK